MCDVGCTIMKVVNSSWYCVILTSTSIDRSEAADGLL